MDYILFKLHTFLNKVVCALCTVEFESCYVRYSLQVVYAKDATYMSELAPHFGLNASELFI